MLCRVPVLLLTAMVFHPSDGQGQAIQVVGNFVGRLTDVKGQPLSGSVSLDVGEAARRTVQTDERGRFKLPDVPVDLVARGYYGRDEFGGIIVSSPGLAPCMVPLPLLVPGHDRDLGDIVLRPGTTVGGTVVLPQGTPAVRARARFSWGERFLGIELRTDASGAFETPPLPIGATELEIRMHGYVREVRSLSINGSCKLQHLQDIVLTAEFPAAGTVCDEGGHPIVGADLLCRVDETKTDAEGRFVLHGVREHELLPLQVRATGFRLHRSLVRFSAHDSTLMQIPLSGPPLAEVRQAASKLEITLSPMHHLRGYALDAENSRAVTVSEVVLCTYTFDENHAPLVRGCRSQQFVQDSAGLLTVEHFGPESYHLLIKAEGYQPFEAFLAPLQEDRDWDVGEFRLRRGSVHDAPSVVTQSIRGAYKATKPSAGADRSGEVLITLWEPGRVIRDAVNCPVFFGRTVPSLAACHRSVITDSDGRFVLEVPFQGDWLVRVDAPGAAPVIAGPVKVAHGVHRDMVMSPVEGGAIKGKVLNASFFPDTGLWAILFNEGTIREARQVDLQGHFGFHDVPPGQYGVKVGFLGFRDREVCRGWTESPTDRERPVNPWARAVKVQVQSGVSADVDVYADID